MRAESCSALLSSPLTGALDMFCVPQARQLLLTSSHCSQDRDCSGGGCVAGTVQWDVHPLLHCSQSWCHLPPAKCPGVVQVRVLQLCWSLLLAEQIENC